MPSPAGRLGDDHPHSERARGYASDVLGGDRWPLAADHVTFETSTRMRRHHGVCTADGTERCTVHLSERTRDRVGLEAMEAVVRHELVYVHQQQTAGSGAGHGDMFARWVEPLALSGRSSTHYDSVPGEFSYRFYCKECGFVGGRHRRSQVVRRAISGGTVCSDCRGGLFLDGPDGVTAEVPDGLKSTRSGPVRYRFHCANCGRVGGRRRVCETVRQVVRGEAVCQGCDSRSVEVQTGSGAVLAVKYL